ncbi:MAG: hypothetical protein MHM6MM_002755 [Cercozoa sp. M6MM]
MRRARLTSASILVLPAIVSLCCNGVAASTSGALGALAGEALTGQEKHQLRAQQMQLDMQRMNEQQYEKSKVMIVHGLGVALNLGALICLIVTCAALMMRKKRGSRGRGGGVRLREGNNDVRLDIRQDGDTDSNVDAAPRSDSESDRASFSTSADDLDRLGATRLP